MGNYSSIIDYKNNQKKKLLADRSDCAREVGKGVPFKTIDGVSIESFNVGQYTGIIVPYGTHVLEAFGYIVEYAGFNGRKIIHKTTPLTKVEVTINDTSTFDLVFSEEDGFQQKSKEEYITSIILQKGHEILLETS